MKYYAAFYNLLLLLFHNFNQEYSNQIVVLITLEVNLK